MVSRKLLLIRAILRNAREVKDPLAKFTTAFRSCSSNGQLVQVRSYSARDMPKELQEWCLDICRVNMAALYDRVWKWDDSKKRKQLTTAASRFLVAHDARAGRAPLAYVNYRFEEDAGHAVLYCYELQVARAAQSRGLGRQLMELAEQIAWGAGMSKLMLTVFTDNTTAVSFYRKLGYVLDETSPDYVEGGGASSSGGGSACSGSSSTGSGSNMGKGSVSTTGCGSCGSGGGTSSLKDRGSGGESQTDSGGSGAGCGYHIMSKRAPMASPTRQQEQQAAAGALHPRQQGQQQQQNSMWVECTQESQQCEEQQCGAVSEQANANKRRRTEAAGMHRSGSKDQLLEQQEQARPEQQQPQLQQLQLQHAVAQQQSRPALRQPERPTSGSTGAGGVTPGGNGDTAGAAGRVELATGPSPQPARADVWDAGQGGRMMVVEAGERDGVRQELDRRMADASKHNAK